MKPTSLPLLVLNLRFILAALLLVTVQPIRSVDFRSRTLSPEVGHPQVGDVDGDGHNDVVLHVHRDEINIKDQTRQAGLVWFQWPDYRRRTIYSGPVCGDRFALADLDGDGRVDVISGKETGKKQYTISWFQNPGRSAAAASETSWTEHHIGDIPGWIKDLLTGDINRDGRLDVVARTHEATVIHFHKAGGWSARKIEHPWKEGLALADLDRDGDLDIVLNGFWLESPANPEEGAFVRHTIDEKWFTQKTGSWQDNCCYVGAADINRDGILDVILAHSENVGYPLAWYSVDSLAQIKTGPWRQHDIAAEFDWCETVDIGDVDNDGDLDVLAAKFRRHDKPGSRSANAPPYPVSIFFNVSGDGARWQRQDLSQEGVYAGVLGDVGSDGDLDIVGPLSYWTGPILLWENLTSTVRWLRKSSATGDLPVPNGGKEQTACLVLDVDKDGRNDIILTERSQAPAIVWLRNLAKGWEQLAIEAGKVPIAAGGACCDIDGDGDLDLIFGSPATGSEVWWWENPLPNNDSAKSWTRRVIANTGKGMHHDQLVGDFLGAGQPQVVSWFQGGDTLLLFPSPADPRRDPPWPVVTVASGIRGGEGLAMGDLDGDGKADIVGGGRWFKHLGGTNFAAFVIDAGQTGGRVAVGDLKQGGAPEVVMVMGDGVGRLKCYECAGDPKEPAAWTSHELLDQPVNHGHSLQIADLNGDGCPDILCGEMAQWGKAVDNREAQAWIFYGNGQGQFTKHVLATGLNFHEAKVADINGDGRLDIVNKPFLWQAPAVEVWLNPLGKP